jgi:hypothetical protein
MSRQLTAEERTRLYCCFRACPDCDAKRGEYCRQKKRGSQYKVWFRAIHAMRSPYFNGRLGAADKARYEKLRGQVRAERSSTADSKDFQTCVMCTEPYCVNCSMAVECKRFCSFLCETRYEVSERGKEPTVLPDGSISTREITAIQSALLNTGEYVFFTKPADIECIIEVRGPGPIGYSHAGMLSRVQLPGEAPLQGRGEAHQPQRRSEDEPPC